MKKKIIDLPVIPAKLTEEERQKMHSRSLDKLLGKKNMKERYARIQDARESEWYEIVERFETNQSLYNAYRYIQYHPVFWRFQGIGDWELFHERCLYIEGGIREGIEFTVVRVDPATQSISLDPALNTQVQIWFEFSIAHQWLQDGMRLHDYKLDGGASSYEQALIKAAKRLHRRYGNDRRQLRQYDKADESE